MPPEEDILKQVEEHIKEINYNPTWFLGFRTKHLEKQSELIGANVQKIRAFILAKERLRELKEDDERNRLVVQRNRQLEDHEFSRKVQEAITLLETEHLRRELIKTAYELGMNPVDYSEVQKQKALVDVEVDKSQKMTGVEVEKHRQMKEVDLDFYKQETAVKLQAALAYQQISVEQAKYLLTKLGQLKTELHDLYFSGLPIQLVEARAKDYQTVIQGWEKKLERLIQGDNGEDAGRGDQNPFRRGLAGPDLAEGEK